MSEMLTPSLPTVSGTMAIDAFVVETGHQMGCRPRLRGHLWVRLGVKDWRVAGLRSKHGLHGNGVAWRAER